MNEPKWIPILLSHRSKILILLLSLIMFSVLISMVLPPAIDWRETFRPAALEVLNWQSPYNITGYLYPPWAILPLLPFALFTESIGRSLLLLLSVATLAYTAYKLGAKPISLGLLLISPPVIHGLLNGNIDWLTVFGFILPPQIGLFFVLIKPQIGVAVVIFWLVEAWRKGKVGQVLRVFGPVALAFLLSILLFDLWPLRYIRPLGYWWNASLWPMSIPLGLALLAIALRKHEIKFAMAASPCLSPYVLFHSWVGALLSIVSLPLETLSAVVGLWIIVIIRFFQG